MKKEPGDPLRSMIPRQYSFIHCPFRLRLLQICFDWRRVIAGVSSSFSLTILPRYLNSLTLFSKNHVPRLLLRKVTQIPLISLRLQRTLLSVAMLCDVMSKSGKATLLAARSFYFKQLFMRQWNNNKYLSQSRNPSNPKCTSINLSSCKSHLWSLW